MLITAIGMSMFLQNLARLIFGADPIVMPKIFPSAIFNIGGIDVSSVTLITIGLSVAMMILLQLFIKNTKQGRAMRAVSENQDAAVSDGNRRKQDDFADVYRIGSALRGSRRYSVQYRVYHDFSDDEHARPEGLHRLVLGGIGSIPSAMLGGFIIGMFETLIKAYISTTWADAIVFALLIIVLVVKPTGILGKNVKEKV